MPRLCTALQSAHAGPLTLLRPSARRCSLGFSGDGGVGQHWHKGGHRGRGGTVQRVGTVVSPGSASVS